MTCLTRTWPLAPHAMPLSAYRFVLTRAWPGGDGECLFVMQNPSTADATHDDPTIKRCIKFAASWGFSSLRVVNTNPVRATDPADCYVPSETILAHNDWHVRRALRGALRVVAAWGVDANAELVARMLRLLAARDVCVLGLTKHGVPRHPLYLRKDTTPELWRRANEDLL